MALTLAQLLGTPADGTDLDRNLEIGVKATGASSAIAVGRVVVLSAGVWAIATSGSTGRMGIVPKLDPVNVDSDDTITVATGINSAWYAEANGTIPVGSRCSPDTGGKLKAFASTNIPNTATFADTTIENAILDFERAPFVYEGHYGEGSGLGNKPTQALVGEAGRFRIAK